MKLKFGDDFEHRCPLPKILKVPIRQLLFKISDIYDFILFLNIVNLKYFFFSFHNIYLSPEEVIFISDKPQQIKL